MTDEAFDALCEALLLEFGLSVGIRISDLDTDIRTISPHAQAVADQLAEDGYTITRTSDQ